MTDKETLKAMFERQKIEHEEEESPDGHRLITVYGGYTGFYSLFEFDADGQLLSVKAYE